MGKLSPGTAIGRHMKGLLFGVNLMCVSNVENLSVGAVNVKDIKESILGKNLMQAVWESLQHTIIV